MDIQKEVKKAIMEIGPQEIEFDSNIIKDELHALLWTPEGELRAEVHSALLELCNRFHKFIGLDVQVEDFLFTGSLCGYGYHDKSDIDLHLLVDYEKLGDPVEVRKKFQLQKFTFNHYRRGTFIRSFPVEFYVQDLPSREPHNPAALYSLKTGWIIKAVKSQPQFDEDKVKELISIYTRAINNLDLIEDNQERLEKAIELKDNIILMRRTSVRRIGEYSEPNLAFKNLRASGHLEKLFDTIRTCMDKKLSLEQRLPHQENLITESFTPGEEKAIREIIKKELAPIVKNSSSRPILSKTEIERISSGQIKKELKNVVTEKDVRILIRKALVNQYHWFWDKRNTWVNQV